MVTDKVMCLGSAYVKFEHFGLGFYVVWFGFVLVQLLVWFGMVLVRDFGKSWVLLSLGFVSRIVRELCCCWSD